MKKEEIKKALECCSKGKCEKCLIGKKDIRKCIDILFKNTLTLINELESENERLLEQRNKTYDIQVKDMEKLKDRIALLEKDNELLRNAKVV